MSGISVYLANRLIYQFCKAGHARFKKSLNNVEAVQRKKLADLLEYSAQTEFGKSRHLNIIFLPAFHLAVMNISGRFGVLAGLDIGRRGCRRVAQCPARAGLRVAFGGEARR